MCLIKLKVLFLVIKPKLKKEGEIKENEEENELSKL